LGADDMTVMQTWVDVSYAVHQDMKSHTGGCVSFGRGAIMSKSSKQKLNTKSTTESEFVGASDYLPSPIWGKKFLEAQGYTIKENIFHQDNEGAIRFETNGRRSCGPNSRHIDIRYFFIKDRLEIENFKVKYCPTKQMLADFFTKPLQGKLFRKLRAVVMGHAHVDSLKDPDTTSDPTLPAPQERVEHKEVVRINGCASSARNADGKATGEAGPKTDGKATVVPTEPGSPEPTKLMPMTSFTKVVRKGTKRRVAKAKAEHARSVKDEGIFPSLLQKNPIVKVI
jgi:hypothetical protein